MHTGRSDLPEPHTPEEDLIMPAHARAAVNPHLDAIPYDQRSVGALLAAAAARRPSHVYFTFDGTAHSLGEVEDRAARLATGLAEAGVAPSTAVAVLMDNSPAYLDVWFALSKLGAVEVPINTAFRGELLRDQLQRSGATAAIVDARYRPAVEEASGDRPLLVLEAGPDARSGSRLEDAYAAAAGAPDLAIDVADVGSVLYTSGTTGPSKGVMLSHHQLLSFGAFYSQISQVGEGDVILNYLPHFHVAGKFLSTSCLMTGARMALRERFSVSRFWEDVRAEGVTNFIAVGGVCNMLAARPERPDDDDNPVRLVYAVPAPAEIYDEFERRFGCRLVEAYGSTEANLVLYTDPEEHAPGSCGRPNPHFEVRVVDGSGDEAVEGEIVVRAKSPLLMFSGYLGMPEATESAWRDGWFHTGDRARLDADGRFWFLDRIKDAIRRRGENISSFEVERMVSAHPGVAEAAAVPTASELGEDEVLVFVVPRDGAEIDPEELFRFCAGTMPYFMVPRFIEPTAELTRTPTNKVAKYQLRERGPSDRTWDAQAAGLKVDRDGAVIAVDPVRRPVA
jgi:crotonobetaine/carnitine-CoA ligase